MTMYKDVDFLIIGQGLTGSLMAMHILAQGQRVMVMGDENNISSSQVAAGMYSPITPKRMTKGWMYDTLIGHALQVYQHLSAQLGANFIHPTDVYNCIATAKEANDFASKMVDNQFAQHIFETHAYQHLLHQPFGSFGIKHSGWLDIPMLTTTVKYHLIAQGAYIAQKVAKDEVQSTNVGVQYQHIRAKYAVWCNGSDMYNWPMWQHAHRGTKGDTLTIRCGGLPEQDILKKGIYLVPLGNQLYKVGATYVRNATDGTPQAEEKQQLIDKLHNMLALPFEVLKHEAAIRPTTPDRKPIVGAIPNHINQYILNGMGTKGVTYAPYFCRQLYMHIVNNHAIMPEVLATRFILS
jgi:glycine oxidase